jgi:hypothetical protein
MLAYNSELSLCVTHKRYSVSSTAAFPEASFAKQTNKKLENT